MSERAWPHRIPRYQAARVSVDLHGSSFHVTPAGAYQDERPCGPETWREAMAEMGHGEYAESFLGPRDQRPSRLTLDTLTETTSYTTSDDFVFDPERGLVYKPRK